MSVLKCIKAKIANDMLDQETAEMFMDRVSARKTELRKALRAGGTPVDEIVEMDATGATLVVGKLGALFGGRLTKARLMALGNPKSWIRDISWQGTKEMELGYKGNSAIGAWGHALVRVSTATAKEAAGQGGKGRAASAQDLLQKYKNFAATVEFKVEKQFRKMRAEILGSSGFQNGALMTQVRASSSYNGIRRLTGRSQEHNAAEFEIWVDKWRKAKARLETNEVVHEIDEVVPKDFLEGLTDEQIEILKKHLDAAAAPVEDMWQTFGRYEVEAGVLKPEDLIPGYTPQIWNKAAIGAATTEFRQFLREVFSEEVDETWAARNFPYVEKDGELLRDGLKPGETMAELAERNPPLSRAIREEWDIEAKSLADTKRTQLTEAIDKELEKHNFKSLAEMDMHYAQLNAGDLKAIKRHEAALEEARKLTKQRKKSMPKAERNKLAEKIAVLQKRIADRNGRIAPLRGKGARLDEIDDFIRRFGKPEMKKQRKTLSKVADRAAKSEQKLNAKDIIEEQIRQIEFQMTQKESFMGLVPDDYKVTSSRFKRRSINLGKYEFDPRADKFLLRDQRAIRDSYARMTGAQLAIRQRFGIKSEGALNKEDVVGDVLEQFNKDIELAKSRGDLKMAKKLERSKDNAAFFMKEALKEFLGDHEVATGAMARASGMMLGVTAMTTLGRVVLSQMTDLAITAFAGGEFMTGISGLFRNNKAILRELAEMDHEDLVVVLQGYSTITGSRVRNLSDMDRLDIDPPGSFIGKVQRTIDDLATAEGYANFMHPWNKWIRGSFGIDFAKQIHRHALGGWDNLTPSLKTFYTRHGLDAEGFDSFAKNYAKGTITTKKGGIKLPDSTKWDADATDMWHRLMQSAGDEAMLDPGVLDRPFMRGSPLGRLVLQFQSFVFTAADRFVAPLIQEFRLHPSSMRSYGALTIGMMMSGLNDFIRSTMFHEGGAEEWLERWDTPEGSLQQMQQIMMRSPFMAASSSWLLEAGATTGLNSRVNDALEGAGAGRYLKEHSKWGAGQRQLGLLGPSAGLYNTGRALLMEEDDPLDAAETLVKRLPLVNGIVQQFLMLQLLREIE